jgi:hypothetical protein
MRQYRGLNLGSDATLVPWSCNAYQTGLKQVELGASIHLTFDQLELGDLTSVCPFDQDIVIAALTTALTSVLLVTVNTSQPGSPGNEILDSHGCVLRRYATSAAEGPPRKSVC